MRILAIGDIHGCTTALNALLARVAPGPDDWIVTLGDYVDRGPDSRGTLDRLLELAGTGQLVSLRGNHEQMMLDTRADVQQAQTWLVNGGQATLESYARPGREPTLDDVPEEHWKFMDVFCVDWFEANTHFFVHAGALPDLHFGDQPWSVLRWQRMSADRPHRSGKIMVCGHTLQPSGWPKDLGHAVCLDTGAYAGGWLTCLDTKSGRFWQANQQGETRESHLDELASQPARA
jgi:serine/threonine protein phosphatase 1